MVAPSDVAAVEFEMVNMAYDPYEYRNEDDDKSWLFDICGAMFMLARMRGDSALMNRLACEAEFNPGLSLRRVDPPSLDEMRDEHEMMVEFFEQLSELNPTSA